MAEKFKILEEKGMIYMLGILAVSHGDLAEGIKSSCEMIAGKQDNLHTLALTEEGVASFAERLRKLLDEMKEKYQHIMILADLLNATPFLQSARLIEDDPDIRLAAGVNLPTALAFILSEKGGQDFDAYVRNIISEQAGSIVLYEPKADEDDDEEL